MQWNRDIGQTMHRNFYPFMMKIERFEHVVELHEIQKNIWITSNFKRFKHDLNYKLECSDSMSKFLA